MKKLTLAFLIFLTSLGVKAQGVAYVYPHAEYFAAPTASGAGDCSSANNPCQISTFWNALAQPNTVLRLADGSYQGLASMIQPPTSIQGKIGAYVMVKAVHDGKVDIDGQTINTPINIASDYVWLEGFNAHHASGAAGNALINIHGHNSVYRRICAWDAQLNWNYSVWEVTGAPAAFTLNVAGGVITACNVTSAGSGYTSAPSVHIYQNGASGGSGGVAHTTLVGTPPSGVATCVVDNGGSGYSNGTPSTTTVAAPFGGGGAGTSGNLLEDDCGFGIARKILSVSQGADSTVVRRFWDRWEGTTQIGPADTSVMLYNTDNTTYENTWHTWSGEQQPQQYLSQNNGALVIYRTSTSGPITVGLGSKTFTLNLATSFNNSAGANGPQFAKVQDHNNASNWMDGPITTQNGGAGTDLTINATTSSGNGNSSSLWDVYIDNQNFSLNASTSTLEIGSSEPGSGFLYGNMAYILSTDPHPPIATYSPLFGLIFTTANASTIFVKDSVTYWATGMGGSQNNLYLHNGGPSATLTVTNSTSFIGSSLGDDIQVNWIKSNNAVSNANEEPSAYYARIGGGETLYTGVTGAKLRYRYKNGVLTTVPLWPWPMAQRIIDATIFAVPSSTADPDGWRRTTFGKSPDE